MEENDEIRNPDTILQPIQMNRIFYKRSLGSSLEYINVDNEPYPGRTNNDQNGNVSVVF